MANLTKIRRKIILKLYKIENPTINNNIKRKIILIVKIILLKTQFKIIIPITINKIIIIVIILKTNLRTSKKIKIQQKIK